MIVDAVVETALRRDRWIVPAMLVAVVVLAWACLLTGAGMGMSIWDVTRISRSAGEMTGMGGVEMMVPASWSLGYAAVMFLISALASQL